MTNRRRVVITGLGAVTPVGNSAREAWENICAGRSGIGPITRFDTTSHQTRIAGEVKNFDPLAFVDPKWLRRLDLFIIYALAASDMAMADAALTGDTAGGDRAGTIIGSAIGGLSSMETAKEAFDRGGPRKISPFALPAALGNLAAGHVSIRYSLRGPINCTTTACSAGNHAIGDSYRIIAGGWADVMLAGGAEAAVTPLGIGGFNVMRAMSLRNDEPEKASRPFDRDRDGFVISEGCGLVVLEEMNRALDRGAPIHAEIVGYGSTADAFHLAAPPPGHAGAARCMREAIRDAGLRPEDIDYINAHGTSTPLNDVYETEAVKDVFGEHSRKIAVSSTKSMTGHLLGATGGVEAIFTAKALEEGILPPTINLDNPDPACDLDYVPNKARRQEIRTALSSTFGFGGANAVIVLRKFAP
ncbi:MAG TPA: beta-ketoacyl-ACP synthase II [Syntrophales bacterium]|nr:beta-ketoacyl-ACP synthase II [Syntrophales bacterium]